MNILKTRPPLLAVWAIDVRDDLRPENIQRALHLLMEKVGQAPFALSVHHDYAVDINKTGYKDNDLYITGTPRYTFTAFVYYPHEHTWRLGTLHEFPKGYVGCACGVLKPFDLFEKEDVNGPS